jgi:hypothetical protein
MSAPRALVTTSLSYKVTNNYAPKIKIMMELALVFVTPQVLQALVGAHRSLVEIEELQSTVGDTRPIISHSLHGTLNNINKRLVKK